MMVNEMTKIKLFREPALNNSRKIKVTHNETNDYHFAVDPKTRINGVPLQYFWFAKLINMKLIERGCELNNPYVPDAVFEPKNCPPSKYISGIIYKQSQYLKSWELRYIVIGPEGLVSFKNETSAESFKIIRETSTELWTRFDLKDKMLIIKLLHAGRKT
jgi:hypothetical protein